MHNNLPTKYVLYIIQKYFVLVPADKPSSNVLIVYKKYYLDVVLKELSMKNGTTSPQTYTPCGAHVDHLVTEHIEFLIEQK